ncbi:hypothetical protein RA19_05200 [Leisingera sp. ANG-M1]|nr:hypothetical protein RA19_05200 [Leisingera sp. ANG-M1]
MKLHFLTAIFCGTFAASAALAQAQPDGDRVAVEVSAGIGHRTSDRFLDTASAEAGLRFGALLGERFRLIGSAARGITRLVEDRARDEGDDFSADYNITAAWDIGGAHEVRLGYSYSRYEYRLGPAPARAFVGESESVRLRYSYFAEWGQAGIGVTEFLGGPSNPAFSVGGEYRLNAPGRKTELYVTGGAGGFARSDDKGFSLGLRAKMPKGYNLYASASRNYFSSGANNSSFSLTLVKSFGVNAGRIFRRH